MINLPERLPEHKSGIVSLLLTDHNKQFFHQHAATQSHGTSWSNQVPQVKHVFILIFRTMFSFSRFSHELYFWKWIISACLLMFLSSQSLLLRFWSRITSFFSIYYLAFYTQYNQPYYLDWAGSICNWHLPSKWMGNAYPLFWLFLTHSLLILNN